MLPTLEVHIPISPTPHFFTMLHYLLESFRQSAGAVYARTHFVITVGDLQPDPARLEALPWRHSYPLQWEWVPLELFRTDSYYATAAERFRRPFQADVALMLDADVLITGPLDDLVRRAHQEQVFLGLVAHASPFVWQRPVANRVWWERLYQAAGLATPPFAYQHPFWDKVLNEPEYQFAPPYFNLGVLAAPSRHMAAIGSSLWHEVRVVNGVVDTVYRLQLAVALAVQRHQLPHAALDLKYNFPITVAETDLPPLTAAEWDDIRICHYLGQGLIAKDQDFADPGAVQALLLRTDLPASLRFFQGRLQRVHAALAPLYPAEVARGRQLFEQAQAVRAAKRDLPRQVAAGQFAEAAQLAETLQNAEPGVAEWPYLLAFSLHAARQEPERALAAYGRAEQLGYNEFWVRYNRGALLFTLEQYPASLADLGRAVALDPQHLEARPLWLACQGAYARALVAAGQWAPAQALLTALTQADDGNGEWRYLQAFVSQQIGDWPRALQGYAEAEARHFDEFWIRYNRAALRLSLGQVDLAWEEAQAAAALQPTHADAAALLRSIQAARLAAGS